MGSHNTPRAKAAEPFDDPAGSPHHHGSEAATFPSEDVPANDDGPQESHEPDEHHSSHPSEPQHHPISDEEQHSASPTEKYNERVAAAATVWVSGLLTGRSYAPRPKKVDEAELSESAKEELLKEATYTVPRGYKYHKDDLPAILSPKPTGPFSVALTVHLVLNFIAFVFTLAASCPVPWYRGRDLVEGDQTYRGRTFTLWGASGGSLPPQRVAAMRTCPIEKQFFQTIAASTIMGCFFTVVSMLLSAVRFTKRGSYGWILLFSLLAFGWTLCGNAMSVSLYYLSRCDASRFSNVARLNAGFALTLVAWVFQLAALLVMVFATRLNVGPVLKSVRVMDTYYMMLLVVVLTFIVIANATTVWKRAFDTPDVKVVRVTYWHTELIMQNGTSLYYGRAHYRCGAFGKRMKASISFLILGSVTVFLALMLGIPAFLARGCRVASLVFAIISAIFLLISWVTAVAVRYRTLCTRPVPDTLYAAYPGVPTGVFSGLTNFPGYTVQEGLILSIIGWVLLVAAIVLNFVVPWPEVLE